MTDEARDEDLTALEEAEAAALMERYKILIPYGELMLALQSA